VRRLGSVVLVAALLVLLPVVTARAADYFVKNGGNDGLDGLSLANAWATLGHAAGLVNPGDTVHVQNGDYQGFYLTRSGTAGNPITFLAEGAAVRITADNGTTPDGINLEGPSHVVIDGFVVDHRTRAGIRAVLGAFVTIRNCTMGFNGRWGFLSGFVDDLVIENNAAHDSQIEHGIYVGNSGDRPVIRGNRVWANHANGIHMNGDESQGGDGVISGALVERNVIYGNGVAGGSGINMDGVSDSVVRNNLLYDNHASGISLYRIDGGSGSHDNLVVNNTIVNAADGRWAVNINNGSSGNRIVNNVLYTYHAFRGVITVDTSSRPGLVSDYNSVMDRFSTDGGDTVIGLAAWQALGYDTHSFVAAPPALFVAPGSDFHLLATSPALDAGTVVGAPGVDLEGNPRPVGAGVDLGAYERQLVSCGDGNVDPGEQCGEPGLGVCADPCTTCSGCTCVTPQPVCGDAVVCGTEECESDGQCAAGEVCQGCECVNAPACTSGIGVQKPSLRLAASPFAIKLKGDAIIPKPWQAVDPLVNGIRFVVDATSGGGSVDVTLPGGAVDASGVGWKRNAAGTQWTYTDRLGSHGVVTKATVKDCSAVAPGLLRWAVKGKGGSISLPDAAEVRSAVILGAPGECAALVWNPPGGARPRCDGDTAALRCR